MIVSLNFCILVDSCFFFFFKQKTAYEMRISDWSSDVCSSDLPVIDKVRAKLLDSAWVKEADVRLRVSGHTLLGEAYVVPASEDGLIENVQRTMQQIRELDWRLHSFTNTPVKSLETTVEEKDRTRARRRPEMDRGGLVPIQIGALPLCDGID